MTKPTMTDSTAPVPTKPTRKRNSFACTLALVLLATTAPTRGNGPTTDPTAQVNGTYGVHWPSLLQCEWVPDDQPMDAELECYQIGGRWCVAAERAKDEGYQLTVTFRTDDGAPLTVNGWPCAHRHAPDEPGHTEFIDDHTFCVEGADPGDDDHKVGSIHWVVQLPALPGTYKHVFNITGRID